MDDHDPVKDERTTIKAEAVCEVFVKGNQVLAFGVSRLVFRWSSAHSYPTANRLRLLVL